jgi:hypothetical protein
LGEVFLARPHTCSHEGGLLEGSLPGLIRPLVPRTKVSTLRGQPGSQRWDRTAYPNHRRARALRQYKAVGREVLVSSSRRVTDMSRLAGATSTSLLEEWLLSVLRIRHIGLLSHERVHYILSVFYCLDSRHKGLTAIPGMAGPASRNADRGFFCHRYDNRLYAGCLGAA